MSAEDKKMKIRNMAATLLTIALSLGVSQSALAEHNCDAEFELVKIAIHPDDFAKAGDAKRLDSKVDAASLKFGLGKTTDSWQKLEDIRTKINGLLADRKEKIDPIAAGIILGEVDDAQLCVLRH
jgi:hypothetical protein